MKIRAKVNICLIVVFMLGLAVSAFVSYRFLHDNAREEVVRTAGLMMATAISIRDYTVNQVRPHLKSLSSQEFLPQTVPAFAATETLDHLRASYPDYVYREAVLNPTNPRDLARSWETEIIDTFRSQPNTKELVDVRDTGKGFALFIARPIQIKNAACLACHSTPEAAPASMVNLYGKDGGFGWQHDEIVGAQLVSVPMSLALKSANDSFLRFMIIIIVVFSVVFVALNLVLSKSVIQPVVKIAKDAYEISKGDFSIPEFNSKKRDEIGDLASSFNRMRRSMQKALNMIS